MARIITLISLFLLSVSQTVLAAPCIAMDSNFNLFAFGLNGKDYNAGTQGNWTGSTPAAEVTATGRPPFNGASPRCYLSQFANSIYVMGADTANPASVYIFNAATSTWSQQTVTTGGFNPASFEAILDHDTNVFYAVTAGEMYFLDMGSLTAANATAIAWSDVGPTPYGSSYNPVMAIANNHISFFDVPNVPAGNTDLYVIHFDYFQPQSQEYPLVSGSGNFPASHGQAVSFFQPDLVQQEIAFIPDDGSNTYVVNVLSNNTQQLAGPTIKDANATYFAGITSLVQLASNGAVSFLPYTQGDDNGNSAATWATVSALAAVAPPTSSSSSSAASTSAKGSATSSASGSQSSSTQAAGSSANKASSIHDISRVLSAALALAAVLCLL